LKDLDKLNEKIDDRVKLFTNILNDYENFIIMQKINDIEIDETTHQIINNIKNSSALPNTILAKKNVPEIDRKCSQSLMTHKNISFCIFNTPMINYFDQTSLKSIKKLYSKQNELGDISAELRARLRQVIMERIHTAIGKKDEDLRLHNQYDKLYKKVKKGKSFSATNSPVINKLDFTPNNRLYNKPEKEEQILTKEFVCMKLNEYKDNCVFTKKVHIKDIVKRYKLNLKSARPLDVGKKLEDTKKILSDYENMKKTPKLNFKEIIKKKPLYPKAVVEANSNYYIRLNRNNLGPVLGIIKLI
jgi:hypothetical protein